MESLFCQHERRSLDDIVSGEPDTTQTDEEEEYQPMGKHSLYMYKLPFYYLFVFFDLNPQIAKSEFNCIK